jgi:hypothetical protein
MTGMEMKVKQAVEATLRVGFGRRPFCCSVGSITGWKLHCLVRDDEIIVTLPDRPTQSPTTSPNAARSCSPGISLTRTTSRLRLSCPSSLRAPGRQPTRRRASWGGLFRALASGGAEDYTALNRG